MPIITSITIQEKNKERCNLFIDGEFKAGVSLETVLIYRLKKGEEISEEKLAEVISSGEFKDALNKATEYASKALKTKKQVRDYLIKKEYSLDTAYKVIDKLKEYGIIDDVNYSRQFIESVGKNQGKKLLTYKLMQKGVKKEDIELAFLDTDISFSDGAEAVLSKYMRNKEKTKENKIKAYRYLTGRGYSFDEIDSALNKFFID